MVIINAAAFFVNEFTRKKALFLCEKKEAKGEIDANMRHASSL